METIIEYIRNPELISPTFFVIWQGLRIIFLLISIFFIGMIIFLLFKSGYMDYRFKENYAELKKTKPALKVKVDKSWDEVIKQAKDEKEAERKMAIIEADDIVNDVLTQVGYEGESLSEKMEGLSEEIIPNIEEVKDAHKKKRDIVYDPNRSLSREEAVEIVSVYEKVFKDLQIF